MPRSNALRKALWISFGIITVAAIGSRFAPRVPNTIPQDIAAVHALGYPTTWAELDARDEKLGINADPYYEKFVASCHALGTDQASDFATFLDRARNKLLSPQERGHALEEFGYLMSPLEQGAKLPRWKPDRPSNDQLEVYEFNIYDRGMILLTETAVYDAKARKTTQALEEMRAAKGICQQLAHSRDLYDLANADDRWVEAAKSVLEDDPETAGGMLAIVDAPAVDLQNEFLAQFIRWTGVFQRPFV